LTYKSRSFAHLILRATTLALCYKVFKKRSDHKVILINKSVNEPSRSVNEPRTIEQVPLFLRDSDRREPKNHEPWAKKNKKTQRI